MAIVPLPLTYTDLVCDLDVDPYGQETTSDLQNLIQDVTHVLLELPGSNPDDPDRGVGVEQYLGGPSNLLQTLVADIQNQFKRDDRITTVKAGVTLQPDDTFIVNIAIGVGDTVIPLEFGWQNGNFTNLG